MQKGKLVALLKANGDSTIIYKGRELEPTVVTTDFKNKYIRSKGGMKIPRTGGVLVWDWTLDSRRIIDPNTVYKVIPLSKTLNNESNDG